MRNMRDLSMRDLSTRRGMRDQSVRQLSLHAVLLLLTCGIMATSASAGMPKIFIVDLGEEYHNWTRYKHELMPTANFYALSRLVPELLMESPYVTTDPESADFFYVDSYMYWNNREFNEMVAALQKYGPYWDRKQGADHIFAVSNDEGRCRYNGPEALNAILLHHYGYLSKPFMTAAHCDLLSNWGARCDPLLNAALASISSSSVPEDEAPPFSACHVPYHDIIVPPTPYEVETALKQRGETFEPLRFESPYFNEELKKLSENRDFIMYYAGKIDLHKGEEHEFTEPWSDAHYSFGSRQTVYRMWHGLPGWQIKTEHSQDTYWQDLSRSVFCLATAGWGWGGRFKTAVTRGCIPVIIQDGIRVEFEEQLPLQDYAIRVPTWLAHKLPQILEAFIETGRVNKMQKVLECAWRLHWWRRPHGRAFEVVMCELKRRLLGRAQGHIRMDWEKCEAYCGDDEPMYLGPDRKPEGH